MSVEMFLVCVIGVVTIGLWIFFFITFRTRYSPDRVLKDIRIEVDKLLIEISREADKDITLIEGRIKGLKALIEEADRRIVLAERESEKRKGEAQVYVDLHDQQQKKRSTRKKTATMTTSIPVTVEKAPVFTQAAQQIKPKIPIKEQIMKLHNTGISAEVIAQRLSLAISEVELTISLFTAYRSDT